MKKHATWLILIIVSLGWSVGCRRTGPVVIPQLSMQPEALQESPPPPEPPTNGVESKVIIDPVKIQPETAAGYDKLPTTVTQLFSKPPRQLALKEVVAETLANNRQLKIEGYNLRIAEYQVPVSKGIYDLLTSALAQYTRTEEQVSSEGFASLGVNSSRTRLGQVGLQQLLPTGATASLAYTAVRTVFLINDITLGPVGVVARPRNIVTYSNQTAFTLTQPLLRGFGREITNAGIRIAQLEQQGAAADFQTEVETQISVALQTYWELIGAIEFFKVQVISYSAARDLMRVNEAKFRAGVVAQTEVLQAQAAAEARREQVIQARQAVRDLEDRLKRLLFLQEGTPLWGEEILPSQPVAWREMEVDLDKAIELALAERSELRRARSNIDQSEVNRRVARNNMLPQVDLFGQVTPNGLDGNYTDSFETMSDGDYISYNAGVSFSYPLQNRTARYRYKQAVARSEQTEELLRDLQDQVVLDVRQAVRDLRTARERIDVTQSQISSARATYEAERKRFEVGISTSFQVLDFQEDVATAAEQHIRAVVDYNRAAVRLERARGTLLRTYGVVVEGTDLTPDAKPVIWPVGFN